MKRSQLNLLVDFLSALSFVALTSTGLFLYWKLPPGSGRVMGPEGPDHSITLLWGWDRHEWGYLHFILGIVFLAILSLHVALHWKWLVTMVTRKQKKESSEPRAVVGLLGLLMLIVSLSPLAGSDRVMTRGEAKRERGIKVAVAPPVVTGREPGEISYQRYCSGCHGKPEQLPRLGLEWKPERLRETPPEQAHQKPSREEIRAIFNFARAVQLSR